MFSSGPLSLLILLQEAIRRLNELQTKAASLDKAKRPVDSQEKLTEMIAIVGRLGLTVRHSLSVVSVTCK